MATTTMSTCLKLIFTWTPLQSLFIVTSTIKLLTRAQFPWNFPGELLPLREKKMRKSIGLTSSWCKKSKRSALASTILRQSRTAQLILSTLMILMMRMSSDLSKQERIKSKFTPNILHLIFRAVSTLARKYQSIRKAVDEDQMLFQDEIFSIEPLQGKIWPNTEITCCVTFRPHGPYHYSCTAFCNVTCSEERRALNMTGQGRGP